MGSGGRWVSGWTKAKLMLNSNPVEDVVEVGVELCNKATKILPYINVSEMSICSAPS